MKTLFLLVASLLGFAGGYLDTYTWITHSVLANAQTANLVFLWVNAMAGKCFGKVKARISIIRRKRPRTVSRWFIRSRCWRRISALRRTFFLGVNPGFPWDG